MSPANTPVALPRSPPGSIPGPLQGLPREFQQHPMLRVHRQRLAGRDAKKRGVEVRYAVHEAAGAGVRLVASVGIRIEQARQVPPAIGGKVGHHVAAVGHHLPEALRGIDSAREAA